MSGENGAPYRPLPFDVERARGRSATRRRLLLVSIVGFVVGVILHAWFG